MQQSQRGAVEIRSSSSPQAPDLLLKWEPWWPRFFRNLRDFLRYEKSVRSAPPGPFWSNILVQRPLPWKSFAQSAGLHVLGVVLLVTFTKLLWSKRFVEVRDPYADTTISYYKVSEYLPEIKPSVRPKAERRNAPMTKSKGDPELAAQEIISVPPTPDNSTQSIINPPHPEILANQAPLPNMVAWTPVSPAPPTAAMSKTQVQVPLLQQTAIPPAPDVSRAKSLVFPKLPQPEVVQPTLATADLRKSAGMEIPLLNAQVEAPKLPAPEPSTTTKTPAAPAAPPPPPSTAGLKPGTQAVGALIALNIHPVEPKDAIKVPDGSRHGIFAATPEGHKGAAGTPDSGDSSGPPSDSGNAPRDGTPGDGPDAGLSIRGGTPAQSPSSAVVQRPPLLAALSKPSLSDLARQTRPPSSSEPKIEDKVFGGKKVYSIEINMPNLTSAGGSWIIHFAELKATAGGGDLSTPIPVDKVDPAYPTDLMRERVEGTVTVYAVIHADGSVGEPRVLSGFDQRLDKSAVNAVLRWHFRPATRNGKPVELEAVFQVPFRSKKAF